MLQYIEEPVQDPRDLAAFYGQTRVPMALDETLDEVFARGSILRDSSATAPQAGLHTITAELGRAAIAGLVVKPGAIGGFERALDLHKWASMQGIQVLHAA